MDIEENESEPREVILGKTIVGSVIAIIVVAGIFMMARNYREVGDRAANKAAEAAERARRAAVVIEKRVPKELAVVFKKVEDFEVRDVVSNAPDEASYVAEFSDGAGVVLVNGSLLGKELKIEVGREGFPPMEVKAGFLHMAKVSMKKRTVGTTWLGRKFKWSPLGVNMVPAVSGKGFAPGYLSQFEWVGLN